MQNEFRKDFFETRDDILLDLGQVFRHEIL